MVQPFKAALRAARDRSGLTQEALAEALQVSVGSVQNWERGDCHPRPGTLSDLEELLGVPGVLTRAAAQDDRAEQADAGQETDFPYFLFKEETAAEVREWRFTPEQQELYGLLCIYGPVNVYNGHHSHFPYAYLQDRNPFQVLQVEQECRCTVNRFQSVFSANNGSTFQGFVQEYLTEHPNVLLSLDSLPHDRIVQWLDDRYEKNARESGSYRYSETDMTHLVAALKTLLPGGERCLGPEALFPPELKHLSSHQKAILKAFDAGPLFRLEERPNTDPAVLKAIAQYESDMETWQAHPQLYDRMPAEPENRSITWIVLTDIGRRLCTWYDGQPAPSVPASL